MSADSEARQEAAETARRWLDNAEKCERAGCMYRHCMNQFEEAFERAMTGTCDCCEKQNTALNFRIAYGIETYACNECCGTEDEDEMTIIGDVAPLLRGETK